MAAYDDLNPRQKAFVDAYLKTGNASEAAKTAGYGKGAAQWGSKLLKTAKVSRALAERTSTASNSRILSAQQVLERLSYEAVDGDDPKARVKALELLGRRYTLWVEKVEVEHKGDVGVVVIPKIATREEWAELWGRSKK